MKREDRQRNEDAEKKMEWREFINNVRNELGLTIPQFARLLGVSVETVQGWLYKRTTPIPFQQELLLQVHENLPRIKAEIEMHKQQDQVPASNQESVWPYVLAGIGTVGAVYGLYKLLDLMFQKRPPQGPTP
jgi:DNA-binding transcriptional regulator YiaG